MSDEESPSESTSLLTFRNNANKPISSTHTDTINGLSSKVNQRKIKLISTTKRKNNRRTKAEFGSRKKKHIQSTSKSKKFKPIVDNCSSTDSDNDAYDNRDPTLVQKNPTK